MIKPNLPYKKIAVAGIIVVFTIANAVLLVLGWQNSKKAAKVNTSAIVPTLAIKSGKETDIDASKQGQQLSEGTYKFETLSASKVNDVGQPGKLVFASHEATGSHFVLAVANDTTLDGKVATGWSVQQMSTDNMWAPGGCASKPTYLLQGKYIFIDDGKTKPTDRYSSYVLYNLQTNQYAYFGGDNFTDTQTQSERILSTANEDDQLVFYIDPTDRTGALRNNSTFKHAVGSDQQYVIRRVINLSTLEYRDYKLPFTVPANMSYYYVEKSYGASLIRLIPDGGSYENYFEGKVTNNRVEFTKFDKSQLAMQQTPVYETDLDRSLNDLLVKALPSLMTGELFQPVNYTYATRFSVTELGKTDTAQFLVARSRTSGTYETPVVYDKTTKKVFPLTTVGFLNDNYVPLGVF